MTRRKLEAYRRLYAALEGMGFEVEEIESLLRIESTLHRWDERECNGEIERDGAAGDGAPYHSDAAWGGKHLAYRIPDRERGALKRLHTLMAKHPGLVAYHQGDPRGCALYVVRLSDVPDVSYLDSYYNRGVAVCV